MLVPLLKASIGLSPTTHILGGYVLEIEGLLTMIKCHGQEHSIGKRKQEREREKEKGSLSPDMHSTADARQSAKLEQKSKRRTVSCTSRYVTDT